MYVKQFLLLTSTLLVFLACGNSEVEGTTAIEDNLEYAQCDINRDSSCINLDEELTLFNSYAYFNKDKNKYRVRIKGWVYEPSTSFITRSIFVNLLELIIGNIDKEPYFFDDRIKPFLVDNLPDEEVIIKIASSTFTLKPSLDTGLFEDDVYLSLEEVSSIIGSDNSLPYRVLLPNGDRRIFSGKAFLLDEKGVMIVSDIDDTIKISEVTKGTKTLLTNTFLKEPLAADGMLSLYQQLASENYDVSFHYVSGSPWQLYNFVHQFVKDNGFEDGAFYLKKLRVNPLSPDLYNFVDKNSTYVHKIESITSMMQDFPTKEFILIGDSGEKDPEVYGYLQEQYPEQVKSIYIRNITNETQNNSRMSEVFGEYADKVILIN